MSRKKTSKTWKWMNSPSGLEITPVFTPEEMGNGDGRGNNFKAALESIADRGDIRAKLLLVALTHFGYKGYDGVAVRVVSEEAGVSKPTMYYHFQHKEGLFRQLCLVALHYTERRIQAIVKDLLPKLKKEQKKENVEGVRLVHLELLRRYVDILQEIPEFTGFIFRSIAVPSPDSPFRDLLPMAEWTIRPLGRYISQAFNIPVEDSRREVDLMTSLVGTLVDEKIRFPEYQIDAADLKWALERWLNGMKELS